MILSNIEISIISQSILGLASVIGLLYKTNHYKKIWRTKYKIKGNELKSSVILSSCKLMWGMLVCHVFNLITANIHCPNISDTSLVYYPMYTLVSGFELGYIFIEPILVNLFRKIGIIYKYTGLKYPDIYPNLKEVFDIKEQKYIMLLYSIISSSSILYYLTSDYNGIYYGVFIILLLITSIFITCIISFPFLLENDNLGKRKIKIDNTLTIYINPKDLIVNYCSWIFIKIVMKSIWVIYIFNSSIKYDMCNIAKNAVFNNKLHNALFYMVFCSLIINTISICYQYIFMHGDKLTYMKNYGFFNNSPIFTRLRKVYKHSSNLILISLFSSIIWVFYIIEKVQKKEVTIDKNIVFISSAIFPSSMYIIFIIIKKIILYFTNYNEHQISLYMNDYNEI
jgi:hypothetical protein